MSISDWVTMLLGFVFAGLGSSLILILFRNSKIRNGKSCDWCEHFCSLKSGEELCCLGNFADEPVPFVRTCWSFSKKASKGVWGRKEQCL